LGAGDARDNAAIFLDEPRNVGEGLGAADPDFCEFRMQGIEKKVHFDMSELCTSDGSCVKRFFSMHALYYIASDLLIIICRVNY